MTIEQRPELNRFVDPSITEPWRFRWQRLKLFLPIWLYVWAFFLELGLFGAWVANKPLLKTLAVSLGPWLAIFLVFIIVWEISLRLNQRSKRIFQFHADKIILGARKSPCIEWKEVLKVQFEPVANSPNLTKLIVSHGIILRKKRRQRIYGLVVESPEEVRELIDWLQRQKTETPTTFELVILDAPSPLQQRQDIFWSMSLFFAGLFLLYHGVPALLALSGSGHHASDGNSRFTPEQRAKLAHFADQHFSTKEEFRHFFLTLGICLTIVGIALMVLGWWLMKRQKQAMPASRSA
jgi:hypothetical protein